MRFAISVGIVVAIAAPRVAEACVRANNGEHRLDAAHAGDNVPPGEVTVEDVQIGRDEPAGCTELAVDCKPVGYISVDVDAMDNVSTRDELGFQVRHVGGTLPRGLELEVTPINNGDSALMFYFDRDSPNFEATLEIRAVDLNGNLGPPTEVVIADGESDGCTTSGRRAASWACVLFAVLVMVRRRKSRAIGC